MNDLIAALQLLQKYYKEDIRSPLYFYQDIMYIVGVSPVDVSSEDLATLLKLGFNVSERDGFFSCRYS